MSAGFRQGYLGQVIRHKWGAEGFGETECGKLA